VKLRKFKRIFKINDLVDLRLVKKRTYIFINNKPTLICASLLINIPEDKIQDYDGIRSIDEAVEIRDKSLDVEDFFLHLDVNLNSEEKQSLRGYYEWMQSHRIPKFDYTCKLVILGDYNVGRSSLIEKHLNYIFFPEKHFFLPYKLASKSIGSDEIIVKLQIWILSYLESHKRFLATFLRGTLGAILMYDITDVKSLDKIPEWVKLIKEYREDLPTLLVGNKIDLEEKRVVSKEQGMALREKYDLSSFMEISVETGENVDDMFNEITAHMINKTENNLVISK